MSAFLGIMGLVVGDLLGNCFAFGVSFSLLRSRSLGLFATGVVSFEVTRELVTLKGVSFLGLVDDPTWCRGDVVSFEVTRELVTLKGVSFLGLVDDLAGVGGSEFETKSSTFSTPVFDFLVVTTAVILQSSITLLASSVFPNSFANKRVIFSFISA